MNQEPGFVVHASLRTPRAAAVSGIISSLLLAAVLVLLKVSTPSNMTSAGEWLTDPAKRRGVALALNLVPFAGITFLWFIGVVRDRIGRREDRFFATIFFGSGLLFIGTLFIAAALAGGLIADATLPSGVGLHTTAVAPDRQVTSLLVRVYAMRMAGVFTLCGATILFRTQAAPRWISALGIAIAVVLLITLGMSPWLYLLFPAWIGLLSCHLLLRSFVQVPPEA
jgi:hypothetical protein